MVNAAEAITSICARAGVKSGRLAVFFTPDDHKPPTLQRVHVKTLTSVGGTFPKGRGPKSNRTARRVIVGRSWLRTNAPTEWAALMAARLLDQSSLPLLKERT